MNSARILPVPFLTLLFLSPFTHATESRSQADVIRAAITHIENQLARFPEHKIEVIGGRPPSLAVSCENLSIAGDFQKRVQCKVTISLTCTRPASWVTYVVARVQVFSSALVTTRPVPAGSSFDQSEAEQRIIDIAAIKGTPISEAATLSGKVSTRNLPVGSPILVESVKNLPLVKAGQLVSVSWSGAGFHLSAEATSLSTAGAFDPAIARTQTGKIVHGKVAANGVIQLIP